MFCNQCGTNIPDNSPRCKKCGTFFPKNLGEYNYKVILTSFLDYSSKKETAKYLASRAKNGDLKTILAKMDKLPLVLMNKVPREKAINIERTFIKHGARLKFVPVIENANDKKRLTEELKKPIKRSYLEDMPLEIPDSVEKLETVAKTYKVRWGLIIALISVFALFLTFVLLPNFYRDFDFTPTGIPNPNTEIPSVDETEADEDIPEEEPTDLGTTKETPLTIPPNLIISPAVPLSQEGKELYEKGLYLDALQKFLEASKKNPGDMTIRRNVAICYTTLGWQETEKGNFDKAESYFSDALQFDKDDYLSYKGIGYIMDTRGNLESAEIYYTKALSLNPDDDDVKLLLGIVLYNREKLGDALTLLKDFSHKHPEDKDVKSYITKIEREYSVEGSFDRKEGSHFIIKFEGSSREVVGEFLLTTLEETYVRVGAELGHYPTQKIAVILYADKDFRDATQTPDWAGAIYDGKIRIPIKGLTGKTEELTKMVTHEYTHAVVFDMAGLGCPTWLNEGLAQYIEGVNVEEADNVVIEYIKLYGSPASLRDLEGGFMGLAESGAYVAYMTSLSATNYLIKNYGIGFVRDLLYDINQGRNIDQSFQGTFYISYDDFMSRWANYLKSKS